MDPVGEQLEILAPAGVFVIPVPPGGGFPPAPRLPGRARPHRSLGRFALFTALSLGVVLAQLALTAFVVHGV